MRFNNQQNQTHIELDKSKEKDLNDSYRFAELLDKGHWLPSQTPTKPITKSENNNVKKEVK